MNSNQEQFNSFWQEKYIKLIILKKDFATSLITAITNNNEREIEVQRKNLEIVKLQIEIMEADHKLFHYQNENIIQPYQ